MEQELILVDSHCHLYMLESYQQRNDLTPIFNNAMQKGVQHFLCVSVDLASSQEIQKIVSQYPKVMASFGIHPNEFLEKELTVQELLTLAPKNIVAIGETGLDYYRNEADVSWQQQRFRNHIKIAKELNKPLIVHSRAAREDTIKILQEEDAKTVGGVLHCFTEDIAMAQAAIALNFFISFSGIITFKNATQLQKVAATIPLDKILIETDCPYLAPEPFRGKPNEPAYVYYVAQAIARLRNETINKVSDQTTKNFFQFLKK